MTNQVTPGPASAGPFTYYVAFYMEIAGPTEPGRPGRLLATTTQTDRAITTPADVDLLASQLRRANPEATTLTILSWQPLDIPSIDPE